MSLDRCLQSALCVLFQLAAMQTLCNCTFTFNWCHVWNSTQLGQQLFIHVRNLREDLFAKESKYKNPKISRCCNSKEKNCNISKFTPEPACSATCHTDIVHEHSSQCAPTCSCRVTNKDKRGRYWKKIKELNQFASCSLQRDALQERPENCCKAHKIESM